MVNFLEQLVAEWYEFSGYYVRRNIRVGLRKEGGHEGELDVVAFNPQKKHLVHIEASMDASNWKKREEQYAKKFAAGRRHIPLLFKGLDLPEEIEQIALVGFGGAGGRKAIGGGRLLLIADFMKEVRPLVARPIDKQAVPEQYVILRSLQYAANYWK